MADFFSDIRNRFEDVLKNINAENVAELITQLDTVNEKGREIGNTFENVWKHGVAPSQSVINDINNVKQSLADVYNAQEQLNNVMHSAWGANGDANIRSKIDLYEQLRVKLRELYSTTQTAEENGDKILDGIQHSSIKIPQSDNAQSAVELGVEQQRAQMESLANTARETGETITRSLSLGQAMAEADTSWIYQEKMSVEQLKETYRQLAEEKKAIEAQ